MTDEEKRTWRRIHAGDLPEMKVGTSMDYGANYRYGFRAFLRDKRALRGMDRPAAVRAARKAFPFGLPLCLALLLSVVAVGWAEPVSYADSPCDVVRVVDGDTVDVLVRVTYWHTEAWRVRLVGIDAPEMRTPAGPPAKEHLAALIVAAKKLRIAVRVSDRNEVVRDKFGRILAELRDAAEAVSLNERMVKDGFAREYHGERRVP